MLEDLTNEEFEGWLTAFRQCPWDEHRKDDRSAVNAMWSSPHLPDDTPLPGFEGPSYSNSKEEDTSESWKRLQAMKRKHLSGQLNRKTSDPPND
jgi:hypothetical protein